MRNNTEDLYATVNVQRFEGFGHSVQDIAMGIKTTSQQLSLTPIRMKVNDTNITGSVQLPWGERQLQRPSAMQLLEQTSLDLKVQLGKDKLNYQDDLLGKPFELQFTGFNAFARPGVPCQPVANCQRLSR
jgi:hypothetical protein